MREATLLFAHGSSDRHWAAPFLRLKALLASRLPGQQVELAFLEGMTPAFAEAIDRIAGEGSATVTVVPLFLAQGGHLREDLPKLIAAAHDRHPDLAFRQLPSLGEVPDVLEAIAAWIAEAQLR